MKEIGNSEREISLRVPMIPGAPKDVSLQFTSTLPRGVFTLGQSEEFCIQKKNK